MPGADVDPLGPDTRNTRPPNSSEMRCVLHFDELVISRRSHDEDLVGKSPSVVLEPEEDIAPVLCGCGDLAVSGD